jgi:Heparinase II/III-like protein/Heparinase II/III N-terminus
VSLGWQKIGARLSQMSLDELRTRLGQELGKRLDFALYRCGITPGNVRPLPPLGTAGKFFFEPGESQARAALIGKHLPRQAQEILERADQILAHKFHLLGYPAVDYGPEIDWHLDAVHGKRAPLKPWYQVRFLEFPQVGDHKITWELNRHQHLVTLAKAWCISGDERYQTELKKQWDGWRRANPYPLGMNWASALEVAFRSMSWLWIQRLLPTDHKFDSDLMPSLAQHGRYIERYLSTYFSPNTHLLGEAVALFFLGTLCPQLPSARRWSTRGWNIIVQEARRQVRRDGIYFEQALYYHVYALDFFLHARLLARRNSIQIPEEFDRVILRMLFVLRALSQAGPPQNFGDDDGGRVFEPARNRSQHMSDPLAIGALTYPHEDFVSAAAWTEESIWLFGDEAVSIFAGVRQPPPLAAQAFPDGGLYVITDPGHGGQRMMIDAGPHGVGRGGHGHADALSIQFTMAGRPWLIDPGTGSYISENDERSLFRGTAAHNTARVDGIDQAAPAGPFAWSSLPAVRADHWIVGKEIDYFAGHHDGYTRLPDPVLHRRGVFHVANRFWFIRDVLEGQREHTVEEFLHFAPDLHLYRQETAVLARPRASRNGIAAETRLAVMTAFDRDWEVEIDSAPFSPSYGIKTSAPSVRIHTRRTLPLECALLMIPSRQEENLGTFREARDNASTGSRVYRYDNSLTAHYFFCAERPGSWNFGAWWSDALFLYCCLANAHLTQFVLLDGSFARWQDRPVINHRRRVERFEWTIRDGTPNLSSSDEAALDFFAGTDLLCPDPVV